jgi:hypothetical protein
MDNPKPNHLTQLSKEEENMLMEDEYEDVIVCKFCDQPMNGGWLADCGCLGVCKYCYEKAHNRCPQCGKKFTNIIIMRGDFKTKSKEQLAAEKSSKELEEFQAEKEEEKMFMEDPRPNQDLSVCQICDQPMRSRFWVVPYGYLGGYKDFYDKTYNCCPHPDCVKKFKTIIRIHKPNHLTQLSKEDIIVCKFCDQPMNRGWLVDCGCLGICKDCYEKAHNRCPQCGKKFTNIIIMRGDFKTKSKEQWAAEKSSKELEEFQADKEAEQKE